MEATLKAGFQENIDDKDRGYKVLEELQEKEERVEKITISTSM